MQDTPPCGFLCASCRFITSSFAEMAFRVSTSDSMTVSPSKVLTGVSKGFRQRDQQVRVGDRYSRLP